MAGVADVVATGSVNVNSESAYILRLPTLTVGMFDCFHFLVGNSYFAPDHNDPGLHRPGVFCACLASGHEVPAVRVLGVHMGDSSEWEIF